jgi:tRNA nucleotidyltransferase (CCA-adding enzyme)
LDNLIPDDVRREVLARIAPTDEELLNQTEVISALRDVLIQRAESIGIHYSFIEPQGSTGRKQTQLRNVADVDLFVGLKPDNHSKILELPQQQRHEEIGHLMAKIVDEWFAPAVSKSDVSRVQKTYSQHPYLSLQMRGLEVDILGCFDIDSETLSESGPFTAVDRTVHHTRYVADNLTDEKRENARILKSFVRACHAYGDRCAVGRMGLTGVSLELIAILSSSLNDAFQSLEHLEDNPIDPKNRSLNVLQKIETFKDNHIFLIDPTDYRRNIASSFSPRAYQWVKHRIGKLSEAPDDEAVLDLILESPIPITEPPKWLSEHVATSEFESDGKIHYTILRDKLYRIAKKAQIQLSVERTGEPRFGMSLVEVYFEKENYAVGLVVEHPEISEQYTRRGPPSNMIEASEEFKKRHPQAELKDGFYWISEKREWNSAVSMFEEFLLSNSINGLSPTKKSEVSKRVLSVLEQFVFPIEPDLLQRITRVKDRVKEKTR